jgi:hypothetical protein
MRVRKRMVTCVGALLAFVGVAVPAPVGAATSLPGFTCGTQSGGTDISGNPSAVTAVRVGSHPNEQPAYDRFVVEFANGPVPKWTAIPKSSANFTLSPSNKPVTLSGTAGIRLAFFTGTFPAYGGQTDLLTRLPQLAEARELEDHEGYVQWGLGLQHQSCKRIFQLAAPTRLVIDVPYNA